MTSADADLVTRMPTKALMRFCAVRLMQRGQFSEAGKLLTQLARIEDREGRAALIEYRPGR